MRVPVGVLWLRLGGMLVAASQGEAASASDIESCAFANVRYMQPPRPPRSIGRSVSVPGASRR